MIFLRNLIRAPARSVMTALGVGGGIGLFVATTALTQDARHQIGAALRRYSLEIVIQERRAEDPLHSRISQAVMDELQARYGASVAPILIGTRIEPWNAFALVVGVTRDFMERVPLAAGSRYREGSGELLLGEIGAQKLGVGPGQTLTLDGRSYRISGVFRFGYRMFDGGAMMDIPLAQKVLLQEGAQPAYSLALVRAEDDAMTRRLVRDINERYPALRATPTTEFAGGLRELRVMDAFVKTISVVILVGIALVVGNTFVMAIAERTREIGILMAVGWTPALVLRMLLAESVLLCVLGAALGNGLALLLLRVLNNLESVGFGWTPLGFPLSLTATSLGLAVFVAVVALIWPAFVLYRLQPLAALRHE